MKCLSFILILCFGSIVSLPAAADVQDNLKNGFEIANYCRQKHHQGLIEDLDLCITRQIVERGLSDEVGEFASVTNNSVNFCRNSGAISPDNPEALGTCVASQLRYYLEIRTKVPQMMRLGVISESEFRVCFKTSEAYRGRDYRILLSCLGLPAPAWELE